MILLIVLFIIKPIFALDIHAHRGGSHVYADNSLEAIKDGLSKKADYIEFDIHMTKDKKFILFHDPVLTVEKCDLNQFNVQKVIIQKITLAQLKTIRCKSKGKQYNYLVSLSDVFELLKIYPHLKLNIEIKYLNKKDLTLRYTEHKNEYPDLSTIILSLNKILSNQNLRDRLIIQSFSKDVLHKVKTEISNVKISYLYKGEYMSLGLERVLRFIPFINQLLWFPDYQKASKDMKTMNPDYFSPNITQAHFIFYRGNYQNKILSMSKNKFKIIPWGVKRRDDLGDFKDYYNGVITDFPENFQNK